MASRSVFFVLALTSVVCGLPVQKEVLGQAPPAYNTTAAYSPTLAERLVNYAGASYCAGQASVKAWNCYACKNVPGFQNITSVYDKKTDGRGIVGYDTQLGARVVAFMGTNANIKTWIDDILIQKQAVYPDCKDCKVHSGFYHTYQGLKSQVLAALKTLPAGKLYVTGHSLGGALATMCAVDLARANIIPDRVITVGQPRVGNKEFVSYYESLRLTHYRVTHHRDPIPHLPYEWMGYEQHTREVYYKDAHASSPTMVCSATNGEDPKCADQFNGNVVFITDHWEYLKFSFAQGVIRCTLQH